jgi:Niemann-Pick C1 protein
MAWEKSVIEYLKNYSNPNMTVSFSTERSIQDELDRESKSDISTILISYMAMFAYITLTLGNYRLCKPLKGANRRRKPNIFLRIFAAFEAIMVDMKFTLGIAGVIIVMLSVVSSIGLFSYFHVKATLIIFEVIPFLVLAVGVDNIFILVQSYQRDRLLDGETLENQIGRIVGRVGPSMLLTSSAESLAFVLGALTPMPAVRIFSLYASLAVFIGFVLQITCFVSLMTLDCKRELAKRYNLFCCITSMSDTSRGVFKSYAPDENLNESETTSNGVVGPGATKRQAEPINESITRESDAQPSTSGQIESEHTEEASGVLFKLFKDYYSPVLMDKRVRPVVIILFLAFFFISLSFLPMVKSGLDQKLSMPKDSYVLDYFKALDQYLSVGVPVYFVVKKGPEYSSIENQNLICSTSGCNIDSVLNQINQASLQPSYSTIAIPANSWYFFLFCCKFIFRVIF